MLASEVMEEVRGRLGGGSASMPTWISGQRMLNRTGRWLVSMYDWPWLTPGEATIGFVQNQDYVTLPTGLKKITGLPRQTWTWNGAAYTVEIVTMPTLLDVRAGGNLVTTGRYSNYWAAVAWINSNNVFTPRLEIYPTPSETIASAFNITYLSGWTAITSDDDTVPIPDFMEALFVETVLAMVKGHLQDDLAAMDRRLMEVLRGPTWRAAVLEAGAFEPQAGPIMGGASETPSYTVEFRGGTVSAPT